MIANEAPWMGYNIGAYRGSMMHQIAQAERMDPCAGC